MLKGPTACAYLLGRWHELHVDLCAGIVDCRSTRVCLVLRIHAGCRRLQGSSPGRGAVHPRTRREGCWLDACRCLGYLCRVLFAPTRRRV
ncbi:hypothetical protein C8Q77DRAFT_1117816 [Trametes polyzona]|nr:hypothetical protein C8Q77DRAFT_1117816 [Trametes polyzona]